MRGDNHLLAVTTTTDEITGEVKPLFAFPVQVCKATDAGVDPKFDLAAPSGAEYETVYRDTATGEVFDYADRLRGVRVGDEFKAIDPDALAAIDEATKIKTMVALGRVERDAALTKYAPRATGIYFLQSPSKGGSHKAYRLTYEALREVRKGKKVVQPAQAIVTKRTARSRQKLALIYADESLGCLVMVEVAFAQALRSPDENVLAPQAADVEEAQIEMARTVIGNLPDGAESLDGECDEAVALKRDLIEQAAAGVAVAAPPKKVAETVEADALEAALVASIG